MKQPGTMLRKIFLVVIILGSGCSPKKERTLTIAVSSNMQFALSEILTTFSQETGIHYQQVISSSGKLTAQIMAGAPFDVFISADLSYPDSLWKSGNTIAPPRIYGYGTLVLWDARGRTRPSLNILKSESIRKIALPNPATAPYGRAAMEVLEHIGLADIETKLVYGESISQANQFILSGAADVGFTAKSVVLSPGLRTTGFWIDIPSEFHGQIAQGAIIVKRERLHQEAQNFYDYLFSPDSKEILKKYGYIFDQE